MLLTSEYRKKLDIEVKEVGFELKSYPHSDNWETVYEIIHKDEVIFKTLKIVAVGAFIKGYKYYCKEAWEI